MACHPLHACSAKGALSVKNCTVETDLAMEFSLLVRFWESTGFFLTLELRKKEKAKLNDFSAGKLFADHRLGVPTHFLKRTGLSLFDCLASARGPDEQYVCVLAL